MSKHGFLIDMDGVIYRGSQLIPGADELIKTLRANAIPFMFLTNNSQRTRRDVATKLQRMGIDVEEEHIFTCAMATARFLASQYGQSERVWQCRIADILENRHMPRVEIYLAIEDFLCNS